MIPVTFTCRRDPLHEAICIAAIRERKRRQAMSEVTAHWRGRDQSGRFVRKEIAA